jgi:hypothetical protein
LAAAREGGDFMAEVLRTKGGSQNVRYPTESTPLGETPAESQREDLPALPATATTSRAYAVNPALNRSAEAVGRSVGTAVAEVRRLPRQLGRLKSRIHLVGESASAAAEDLRSSAEEKAAGLRDAAEVGLLELADKASLYTSEMGGRASERIESLRREAWWKLAAVRTIVRHRAAELRRWEPERPLQVIVVSASAAFALGVMLRIWRSSND